MDKFVDIIIAPDGTMKIDMECYQGKGCDIDFKKLAKAMGATVVSSKKKDEFYDEGKVQIKGQE